MNQTELIKKYLDFRFKDVYSADDSLRRFFTNTDGKKVLRFGIIDERFDDAVSIVLVHRKDIMAIQDMFGLTYQNSERVLVDYIINRLNYDSPNEINVAIVDL